MSVSRNEVERIAALARLKFEPDAMARLAGEMNGILEHMAALREVDVEGVPEMVGVGVGGAPHRSPRDQPDPLHAPPSDMAPEWHEGFFMVPRLPAVDGVESGDGSGPGDEA